MEYYLIYSAGGGGGEWNGLKRIWKNHVKEELKSRILIKFGDIFFNHENVGRTLYKPDLWKYLHDARGWIAESTGDEYVMKKSSIILDSGTAKAVSWIASHHPGLGPREFISEFDGIANDCALLDKYADVVRTSDIDLAVTLDIPNPFKVRARSNTFLNLIETGDNRPFIEAMAKYANQLHKRLGEEKRDRLLTIVNGLWTAEEYEAFLNMLDYRPKNIAVGGLSAASLSAFQKAMGEVKDYRLNDCERVHFLGCGGMRKVRILKENGYGGGKFSVDCSTPINRSFADRVSKYYIYGSNEKIEVSKETKNDILRLNQSAKAPYYSQEELEQILDMIIKHQRGEHTEKTFDARAMLMLHNSDVFRQNAL